MEMGSTKHVPVVAVGGGPAGISFAIECIAQGIKPEDVLVLEKGAVAIEAIRKFYPEKKMTIANYKGLPTQTLGHLEIFPDLTKAQTLDYFDDLIKKYNVQMQYNAEASKVLKRGSHFEILIGHDIVTADFVGIGIGILGRPNKPTHKLPGSLRSHLLYDITSQQVEGMKVLVVGGGDTSSEYCQVLVEEKNEVTLAYRGNRFARMMQQNSSAVETLKAHGKLRVWLECSVKEIADKDSKPHVIFENEKFASEVFDKVIFSIGGTTPVNFLKTIGVEFDGDWPKFGPSGETNVSGLYLIGDLVAGKLGGSIITAYNSSFRSAKHLLGQKKK
jgi:thioredoxin reductase (NADPH)